MEAELGVPLHLRPREDDKMEPHLGSPIYVTAGQMLQLERLLSSRAHADLLVTKNVDMETSQGGFVFVIEKPGKWPRSKVLELRRELSAGRLNLTGLQPTGRDRGGQFGTQFPGCYVVAVDRPRRERFNFLPFE